MKIKTVSISYSDKNNVEEKTGDKSRGGTLLDHQDAILSGDFEILPSF